MTIARSRSLALAVALATSVAGTVHAQAVDAEALFREGKRLMKEGKLAEACDRFEASERVAASVGTLLNLGDCRERSDRLASAWAAFHAAAAAADRAGNEHRRAGEARRRADVLEPRLAMLAIDVPEPSRVDGLVIERDGLAIDVGEWNHSVPIDAGHHTIACHAPDREPWSTAIDVDADGQQLTLDVPLLEPVAPEPPKAAPPAPVVEPPPPPAPAPAPAPPPAPLPMWTHARQAAVTVAAVGVASIVTGAVLGAHANVLEAQADALCPATACSDRHALDLNSDARSDSRLANLAYVAGGLAIAGGAALWVWGHPERGRAVSVTPAVGPDRAAVVIGGRF
ncbi:MAG TPA: hypothetical protein VMJ10_29175 [Kofleriaceae bacterium]|nr:hypothetical protein [Kofleriaceae bacterium]